MHRFCLTLARLCSAIWIGAAFLFVATSVTEQTHPAFDSHTKDALALIRFPWFYGTGFVVLAVACVATWFTRTPSRFRVTVSVLLVSALTLMLLDHTLIYRPLRALLSSHAARGLQFEQLHHWSEWINAAGFLLALAAAVLLCAAREVVRPPQDGEATRR